MQKHSTSNTKHSMIQAHILPKHPQRITGVHKKFVPCNVVIVGSYTTNTLIFSLTSVEFSIF